MTKIAIFSDIHGNLEALKAIINDLNNNIYEEIICLGDVIAIGPQSRECLDLIINSNIRLLLGNHELYYLYGTDIDDEMNEEKIKHQQWVASNLNDSYKQYLNKCKLEYSLNINNYKIGFKHFLMESNDKYPFYEVSILRDGSINKILSHEDSDILFLGHEHKTYHIGSKVIGVGSSGCTKGNKTFYTTLTINDLGFNIEKKYLNYDRLAFESIMQQIDYPFKKHINKNFFGIEDK